MGDIRRFQPRREILPNDSTLRQLVEVVTGPSSLPEGGGVYFLCKPFQIAGTEVVGGPALLSHIGNFQFPVAFFGSKPPAIGSRWMSQWIPHRWVVVTGKPETCPEFCMYVSGSCGGFAIPGVFVEFIQEGEVIYSATSKGPIIIVGDANLFGDGLYRGDNPPTVTIMGDGSGATAEMIFSSHFGAGVPSGYRVLTGGDDYTYATVTISNPGGSSGMGTAPPGSGALAGAFIRASACIDNPDDGYYDLRFSKPGYITQTYTSHPGPLGTIQPAIAVGGLAGCYAYISPLINLEKVEIGIRVYGCAGEMGAHVQDIDQNFSLPNALAGASVTIVDEMGTTLATGSIPALTPIFALNGILGSDYTSSLQLILTIPSGIGNPTKFKIQVASIGKYQVYESPLYNAFPCPKLQTLYRSDIGNFQVTANAYQIEMQPLSGYHCISTGCSGTPYNPYSSVGIRVDTIADIPMPPNRPSPVRDTLFLTDVRRGGLLVTLTYGNYTLPGGGTRNGWKGTQSINYHSGEPFNTSGSTNCNGRDCPDGTYTLHYFLPQDCGPVITWFKLNPRDHTLALADDVTCGCPGDPSDGLLPSYLIYANWYMDHDVFSWGSFKYDSTPPVSNFGTPIYNPFLDSFLITE